MFGSNSFSWPSWSSALSNGASLLKAATVVVVSTTSIISTRLLGVKANELDTELTTQESTNDIITGIDAYLAVNEQLYDQTFMQGIVENKAIPTHWLVDEHDWIANLSIQFQNGSAGPSWLNVKPPITWYKATTLYANLPHPLQTYNSSLDFAQPVDDKLYMLIDTAGLGRPQQLGALVISDERADGLATVYPIQGTPGTKQWYGWMLKDSNTALALGINGMTVYDLANLTSITETHTQAYPFGTIISPPTIICSTHQRITYMVSHLDNDAYRVSALDLSNHYNITLLASFDVEQLEDPSIIYTKTSLKQQALYFARDYYNLFGAPLHSNLYQYTRASNGNLTASHLLMNTSIALSHLWPDQASAMILTDFHINETLSIAYTVNILYENHQQHAVGIVLLNTVTSDIISHTDYSNIATQISPTLLINDYLYIFTGTLINLIDGTVNHRLSTIDLRDKLTPTVSNQIPLGNITVTHLLIDEHLHYRVGECGITTCRQAVTGARYNGIQIINIDNPGQPTLEHTIYAPSLSGYLLDENLLSFSTGRALSIEDQPSQQSELSLQLYKRDNHHWQKLYSTALPHTCNGLIPYKNYAYCSNQLSNAGLTRIYLGVSEWTIISTAYEVASATYDFNLIVSCANVCNLHYPFRITLIDKIQITHPLTVQSLSFDNSWQFTFPQTLFEGMDDFLLIKTHFSSTQALSWINSEYEPTTRKTLTINDLEVHDIYNDGLLIGNPSDYSSNLVFWQLDAEDQATYLATLNNTNGYTLVRNASRLFILRYTKAVDVVDMTDRAHPTIIGSWHGSTTNPNSIFDFYPYPSKPKGILIEYAFSPSYFQVTHLDFANPNNITVIYASTPNEGYYPVSNSYPSGVILSERGLLYMTYHLQWQAEPVIDVVSIIDPHPPQLLQRYTPPSNTLQDIYQTLSNQWLLGWSSHHLTAIDTRNPRKLSAAFSNELTIEGQPLVIQFVLPANQLLIIGGFLNHVGYIGIMDSSNMDELNWIMYAKYPYDVNSFCGILSSLDVYKLNQTHLLLYNTLSGGMHPKSVFCSFDFGYTALRVSAPLVPISDHELRELTFTAQDAFSHTVAVPLTLGLNNNPPAVAHPIGNRSVNIGSPIDLNIVDVFSDRDGDELSFASNLVGGTALPVWLTFLPELQEFFGTPSLSDATTLHIQVTANDGFGGTTSDELYLIVNIPPTLSSSIPSQVALVGADFEYIFPPTTFHSSNSLTYRAKQLGGDALPPGLAFSGNERRFYTNSSLLTAGSAHIELTASDPYGGQLSTSFTFEAVTAPQVTTAELDTQIYINDGNLNYQIPPSVFIGGNGKPLVLHAQCIPSIKKPCPIEWLFFNPNTARFSGQPPHSSQGTYLLEVTATDPLVASHFPNNGSVTTLVHIDVPNRAPVVEQAIPSLQAFIWEPTAFVIPITLFVDPDGDSLNIVVTEEGKTTLPTWLNYDPSSRVLSGTPSLIPWQGDNLDLAIKATDPFGASTKSEFQILVSSSVVVKDIAKWYALSGTGMTLCWMIARWYRLKQLNTQKPKFNAFSTKQNDKHALAPAAAVDELALKSHVERTYQKVKVFIESKATNRMIAAIDEHKEAIDHYLKQLPMRSLSTLPDILALVSSLINVVHTMNQEIIELNTAMPWLIRARGLLDFILMQNASQAGWVLAEHKARIEAQIDSLTIRSSARGDISNDILHHLELIKEALRHLTDDDNWQYVGISNTTFATHIAQMVAVPPYGAYSFWSEGVLTVGSWYIKLLEIEHIIYTAGNQITTEIIQQVQHALDNENDWRFIYAIISLLGEVALSEDVDEAIVDQIVDGRDQQHMKTVSSLSELERFNRYRLAQVNCCGLTDRNKQIREKAHTIMDAIRDKYIGRYGGWKEVSYNRFDDDFSGDDSMELTAYRKL